MDSIGTDLNQNRNTQRMHDFEEYKHVIEHVYILLNKWCKVDLSYNTKVEHVIPLNELGFIGYFWIPRLTLYLYMLTWKQCLKLISWISPVFSNGTLTSSLVTLRIPSTAVTVNTYVLPTVNPSVSSIQFLELFIRSTTLNCSPAEITFNNDKTFVF